jgi:hypothetical protein
LPASGKSYLGNQIEHELFIDDISVNGGLECLNGLDDYEEEIIISDVFLCLQKNREKATEIITKLYPKATIEWIFFENNPDKCFKNLEKRKKSGDNRKVSNMISMMSKLYTIPDGIEAREIYDEK